MTEVVRQDAPHPLLRSFLVLSGGQLVARSLTFLLTVHLTRALGAAGFGIVVFATATLSYAILVVDFGFGVLGPLEAARRPQRIPRLAGTLLVLRGLLALLGFVLLALFLELAPVPDLARVVALLYGLALLASALDLSWVFLGVLPMRPVALADIFSAALILVSAWSLVRTPEDVVRMPWIFLGGQLAQAAFLAISFALRFGRPRLALDRALLRELIPEALPLLGSAALGQLLNNFDVVLLGVWLGTSSAGVYGAAYRFVQFLGLLALSYFRALRPPLARASLQGLQSAQPWLGRSYEISTALAFGAAVGGVVLADGLVVRLFGAPYAAAAQPLRLLLCAFGLMVLNRHYRICLVAFGHQTLYLGQQAIATALNVGLNILLIPRWGILGSAWAMLAAEVFQTLAGYWSAHRRLGPVPGPRLVLRPLLCAALLGVLLRAIEGSGLFVKIGVGAVSYILLLLSLRVFSVGEFLRSLRDAVRA